MMDCKKCENFKIKENYTWSKYTKYDCINYKPKEDIIYVPDEIKITKT